MSASHSLPSLQSPPTTKGVNQEAGNTEIDSALSSPFIDGTPIAAFVLAGEIGSRHEGITRPLQCEEGDVCVAHDPLAKNIDAMVFTSQPSSQY